MFSGIHKRFEHELDAHVEEIGKCTSTRRWASDMFEASGGEIAKEYLCLSGGLFPYLLRKITYSEIDWICSLSPKQRELCLVR